MQKSYIGVDVGGTTIKVGRVSHQRLVESLVVDTQAAVGGDTTLQVLLDAIRQLMDPTVEGIGIGVPSVVDRRTGIVYDVHNIRNWQQVPLAELVSQAFGLRVWIDNDANCFALGEKLFGTGMNYEHFVGITLGTGVGGGIVQAGRLLSDANCGSGEYGELPYLDSIVEDYCGSRFFLEKYQLSGQEAYRLAQQGDPQALALFDNYGAHLANLVKMVVLTVDPQAILLGGAIAQSFPYFEPAMRREMKQFLYGRSMEALEIRCSTLPQSGILGAAALAIINS